MCYVSASLYYPSFPALQQFFAVKKSSIQLSLTWFYLGSACFQILFGFVSDTFGRKPTLVSGSLLFIAGTILAIFSLNVETFWLARFMQGSGAAVFSVIWKVILGDTCDRQNFAKANSYITIAWSSLPIAMPIIGSYIQHYSNWQGNFYFMLLAGILMLSFSSFYYRESLKTPSQDSIKHIAKLYYSVITEPIFIISVICFILLDFTDIGFGVEAPFLLQTDLHLSTIVYGWCVLLVAIGSLLGGVLHHSLVGKVNGQKLVMTGAIGICSVSFIFSVMSICGIFTWWSVLAPMFLMQILLCFPFATLVATAMSAFEKRKGIASAALGVMFMLTAAGSTLLMAALPKGSPISLSCCIFIAAVLSLALLQKWKKLANFSSQS